MAGAVTGLFSAIYGEDRPVITIVEPNKADCLYRTAEANDGERHFVTGDMNTIMAGLACGEPCQHWWEDPFRLCRSLYLLPGLCSSKGNAYSR